MHLKRNLRLSLEIYWLNSDVSYRDLHKEKEMSITTTYTCDRCGHSQNSQTQMWALRVVVQHLPIPHNWCGDRWYPNDNTPVWCRSCCEKIGLVGKPPTVIEPSVYVPTSLEDQIRAIIQEELSNNRE